MPRSIGRLRSFLLELKQLQIFEARREPRFNQDAPGVSNSKRNDLPDAELRHLVYLSGSAGKTVVGVMPWPLILAFRWAEGRRYDS